MAQGRLPWPCKKGEKLRPEKSRPASLKIGKIASQSERKEEIDMSRIESAVMILRLPQVIQKTGLCRSSIYERIKDDQFPHQVSLGGGRAVGWIEAEIDEWLQEQISRSRSGLSGEGDQNQNFQKMENASRSKTGDVSHPSAQKVAYGQKEVRP
jgi:prophage regulatory protein